MDESSKLMESQLRKARDDAEIWRKTCWELEGHFIDLKQMEHQEVELEKQHKANIGMFNELYFQFDKKKLECFQVKKKLDALVAENGNFVYDASLKYRVQELMKQADLWVNQELRMKYCVDEYKSKYETLLLKFKEKEIECNRLKEKRKKKSASIGVVARIDVLEEEYRKMESEEREKRVRLSMEIEGLKCAKKSADDEVEKLKIQLLNANVNLGGELEDYKAKYHGLLTQLNQRAELEDRLTEMIKIQDNELMDCRVGCSRMQEQITGLTRERNAMSEREQMAQDKVAYLEEVVERNETANRVLESWKIKAEDEMESWMTRLAELETRVLSAKEALRALQNDVSCRKTEGSRRVDVANMFHPELMIDNMLVEPNIKPSSLRGNFEDVHVQGINNQREPSRNDTDKKKNVCPASIVESVVIPVEHHTALETEGSLGVGPVLLKQVASLPTDVIEIEDEIIEVNDSEDEKEITAAHLCSVKGKEKPHVSTDEASDPSGKYLKRRLSLQDEKCEGSSGKDILTPFSPLCSSTKKRLRVSETET